jgi:hypothetical protein
MADNKFKVSPGLEDRLLEYAAAAEAVGEHQMSSSISRGLVPALPFLDSPVAFVSDMREAAACVGAVRNILERRGR